MWTLITGSAKGLGREIALSLAEKGYHLALHYRNSQKEVLSLQEACLAKGVSCEIIAGDFSTHEGIVSFIQEYQNRFASTLHLINNVGNFVKKPLLETEEAEWLDLLQTNVHAPRLLSKALQPTLESIVNLGMCGLHSFRLLNCPAYLICKQALFMMTRVLAKEMAPNIRVNMVSPGYTTTTHEDTSILPMQRAATPQEIARAVVFLMDPQSAYITGQNIEVAGGVGL